MHMPVSKSKETLGGDFVNSRSGGQNQKACHIFYLFSLLLALCYSHGSYQLTSFNVIF